MSILRRVVGEEDLLTVLESGNVLTSFWASLSGGADGHEVDAHDDVLRRRGDDRLPVAQG